MTDKLKTFLEKASKDDALKEKLEALQNETDRAKVVAETIAIAKEAGYELSEVDFEADDGEMDDAEMQAVSGGWTTCVCVAGGGGTEDADGKTCACVALGLGYRKDNGNRRCICVVAGEGYDGKNCGCGASGGGPLV